MSVYKRLFSSIIMAALLDISPVFAVETIDNIILGRAVSSQTLMFGELHENRPKEDDYVISLLPRLKELGYTILVIEMKYSDDAIIQQYLRAEVGDEELDRLLNSRHDPSSTKKMIKAAAKLGFSVRALDFDTANNYRCKINLRDKKTFENIKREIFDKNPKEKVVFFYGSVHVSEAKEGTLDSFGCSVTPLGYYLEKNYNNLSVDLTLPYTIKRNIRADLSFDISILPQF